MRRTDREITDFSQIMDILNRCDTVRLAMQDEGAPYVVPLSFGVEEREGKATVYFHCAREGKKVELLRKNAQVCVQADRFLAVQQTQRGVTTHYESVIGYGHCEELTDPADRRHGYELLLRHYGQPLSILDACLAEGKTRVYRVVLERVTGKANPMV